VQHVFPPIEIQAGPDALRRLTSGLDGWRVERMDADASNASNVWLKDAGGNVWQVSVNQRDLSPMFEVFTLGMLSLDELRDRSAHWQPPSCPPMRPSP
jgi:hypothetical protein